MFSAWRCGYTLVVRKVEVASLADSPEPPLSRDNLRLWVPVSSPEIRRLHSRSKDFTASASRRVVVKRKELFYFMLSLSMQEIESLDAPGWGEWVAGIGVGSVVGGGLVYGGIAIGVAIT